MISKAKEVKQTPAKMIETDPSSSEPKHTCLKHLGFRIGALLGIEVMDDMALAHVNLVCPHCGQLYQEWVEVPADIEGKLRDLVGTKVNISRLFDKYYVAESTPEESP